MKDFEQVKIYWLTRLRWLAIILQSVLLIPAVHVGYVEKQNIPFYLAVTFILVLVNIQKIWTKIRFTNSLTYQLNIDLIAFICLILLSGKMENPFWSLIYIHAGIGAILLRAGHSAYYLPTLILGMLSVHISSYSFHSALLYTIIPQWIILITAWSLTRIIGISLIKQREKLNQLEKQNLKIQKLKSIGALSAGILHEIGTPLNTIRLKTDRLQNRQKYNEADIQILDKALTQCEETISKLNSAQQEVEGKIIETINISHYLMHLNKKWETEFSGLKIHLETQNDFLCKIAKVNLSIVLNVFLENSLEANATKAFINISKSEDFIILNYNDNGEGFSDFILENFGAPYTSTKGRGRGLGLFSSLISIESMGGSMKISNNNGANIVLEFQKG